MPTTAVLTHKAHTINNQTVVDHMDVDLMDSAELLKKTERFSKIEIRATENNPKYYIHMHPMVLSKEIVNTIKEEEFTKLITETLAPGVKLDLTLFERFRDETKPMLDKTPEDKTLLFCKNGYFDIVSSDDMIMTAKGKIIPIKQVLAR